MAVPTDRSKYLSNYEKEREGRIAANLKKIEELGVCAAAEQLHGIIASPTKGPKAERKTRSKGTVPEEDQRRSGRAVKKVTYNEDEYLKDLGRLPGMRAPRVPRGPLDEAEVQELRDRHGVAADDADMTASQQETKEKKRGPVDSGKGVRIQGGKVYDSKFGVTCHWCRQKTLTENVSCSNPSCGGGRRLPTTFCKGCLRNRHGEDSTAAAASGAWVCPGCRVSCGHGCVKCCNCGPCRKKCGLEPTHQVKSSAKEAGFDNVHDYLVHLVTGESSEDIAARKQSQPWGAWMSGAVRAAMEGGCEQAEAGPSKAEKAVAPKRRGRKAAGPSTEDGAGAEEPATASKDTVAEDSKPAAKRQRKQKPDEAAEVEADGPGAEGRTPMEKAEQVAQATPDTKGAEEEEAGPKLTRKQRALLKLGLGTGRPAGVISVM